VVDNMLCKIGERVFMPATLETCVRMRTALQSVLNVIRQEPESDCSVGQSMLSALQWTCIILSSFIKYYPSVCEWKNNVILYISFDVFVVEVAQIVR
jgi:hypothetical protein